MNGCTGLGSYEKKKCANHAAHLPWLWISPDPLIVERMLSQSRTMVFRRCAAWRLLHSSADFRKKPLPQCSRTPVDMNASQTGRTWLLRTTLTTLPNTMAVSRETHVSNNHSEKGNQKKGLRDPA